ncbi:MAG TPA: penicillin acylase family protein [Woeseiaceae bacterium]|nr:penicillin acylase family protein [Woeseiaceae bacterium]
MNKLLKRMLLAAVATLVVLVFVAFLLLRGSLPQIDGQLALAGLEAPATIERDAAGIPVITANSRVDLAFATGFAHGQDRFFQIDLIRRQAAGELSELFGEVTVQTDKQHRFHRFRALANQVLEHALPSDRALIERYAEGVNAGLASLAARPFEYFVIGHKPEKWRAEDSILVVYAMFMQLNDARARQDVRRGYAYRVLPTAVYDWLYPPGTSWDAPLMGGPPAQQALPGEDEYSLRDLPDPISARAGHDTRQLARRSPEQGRAPVPGSNSWAVSGAHTESGRAMVSNDMHLGLSVPNIYYRARFVIPGARGIDLTGVSLPGTPFIVAGSNGHIAWGFTNSYGDYSDAIVLRPGKTPGTYRTPDGERSFAVHTESIAIDGAAPEAYEIRETLWGPVDDTVSYPDGEIAVSWIAHFPTAVNLNLIKLETARTVAEALDIANTMGMPPQNFVTGDADGNIGWTIAGKIPKKAHFNPMVPSDWSAQAGWTGWREADEYPRIINPPGGRIWTANARVVDGKALEIIGDGGYDLAARAQQVRDDLLAKDIFSAIDMLAIQVDDRALFLGRWRDLLLDVLDADTVGDDAALAEYRRLVENWVPRAVAESTGYRLVRAFRNEVRTRVWNGLMEPVQAHYEKPVDALTSNQFEAPLWQLLEERPVHLLAPGYTSWDALLLEAISSNLAWFADNYDSPLAERSWGEINTAAIRHPLSSALPWLSRWLDMPAVALDGDANMPRAQGPAFGASERFSVAPGNEEAGLMQMPTGQSGHPLSGFFKSGHDDWVQGRPRPFWPEKAEHRLSLLPIGGIMDN